MFLATSVNVEYIFNHARILLSYICNHLSAQTTHALMCLETWSKLGYVEDKDVHTVSQLSDVEGEEDDLKEGWDAICIIGTGLGSLVLSSHLQVHTTNV